MRKYKRKLSGPGLSLLLVAGVVLFGRGESSFGRGIDSINPEKSQGAGQKKSRTKEKDKQRISSSVPDYDFELFVSVETSLSSGSLNKADEEPEKITSQTIGVRVQAGILLGDNFEPVLEVHQTQRTAKIGDYESKSSALNWGIGALFNVPMGDPVEPADSGVNSPVLSNSTWIPYGGFILTSVGSSDTDGNTATSEVKNSGMSTRLIFGSRYMLYPHLAINFWIRMSYEKKDSSATETATTGGSVSKLSVDANLFSFSVFI